MLADKRYDSDDCTALLMKGIVPVIQPKSNRRDPIACEFRAYKDCNRVERMFNRIKQFRRIATRYDKTAISLHGLSGARIRQAMGAIFCQHSPAVVADEVIEGKRVGNYQARYDQIR